LRDFDINLLFIIYLFTSHLFVHIMTCCCYTRLIMRRLRLVRG